MRGDRVSKTNYPYAESLSYDIEADEETTYEKISIIVFKVKF